MAIRTETCSSSFSPPKLRYSWVVLGSISSPASPPGCLTVTRHLSFQRQASFCLHSCKRAVTSITRIQIKSLPFGYTMHSMFQEQQICSSNSLWLQLILKRGGREQGRSLALMTCHKQKTESSQQLELCPVTANGWLSRSTARSRQPPPQPPPLAQPRTTASPSS